MPFMSLGAITFEPLPITGISEKYSYDFVEHAVIEGKPLLQYIGDKLVETPLNIRLHVSFCDPKSAFEQLKTLADTHKAQRLSFGDGTNCGMRVITEISKTMVKTADNGNPMVIEASVSLKEWVDTDPLGSRQKAQQTSAPGLVGTGPIGLVRSAAMQQAIIVGGQVKAAASQIGKQSDQMQALAATLTTAHAGIAAQLKAASASIKASVGPVMAQAQAIAAGVQGAAANVQSQIAAISGISSNIARITCGLPYPASLIGNRIAAINSRISKQATQAITLTSLVQGGAIEAGTRAQMITRMLPGK